MPAAEHELNIFHEKVSAVLAGGDGYVRSVCRTA